MADSRPAEDLTATVAHLRKEFEDRIATLMARSNRRPVGTIEMTLRTASLPYGTLVLDGSSVSRTTYADLWAWANDTGALAAGFFGTGDGSTTFALPNLGGKFVVGAGTGYAPGDTGGAETVTLTTSQIPAHDHAWNASWNIANGGVHAGHTTGSFAAQSGVGVTIPDLFNQNGGDHTHTLDFDLTIDGGGGGGAHENLPPYLALYYVIWF